MTLPAAVASGRAAETPDAVKPLHIGIGAGALAALYLVVLYLAHPVPARMIALVGGPTDAFARQGGLSMVWLPPPGTDIAVVEERFASSAMGGRLRRGPDGLVVELPGIAEDDVIPVARRLTKGGGVLEFREVVQVDEMRQLASVLGLPMSSAKPIDLEIDQWRLDEGGETQTDYYLIGETREALDQALLEADRRGWKLPAGTTIALENLQASDVRLTGWRTYVLAEQVELDGESILDAVKSFDPNVNRSIVLLDFKRAAAETFGQLTQRIVGKKLAIVVDGLVASAPIINGAIHGGRASITMGGSDPQQQEREAELLVSTLRGAALPAGGEIRDVRYVRPGDTAAKVWTARVLIAVGGGALVGLLAWALVRALRPSRRRAPEPAPRAWPWRRIGITLLAPASVIGASYVPILGIDHAELAEYAGPQTSDLLNVGMLGVSPVITAYVVVEALALVIPSWRHRRHAGADARRPLDHAVFALAFGLVMLQSWTIIQYLQSLVGNFGLTELGTGSRALVAGSLAAGTLAFVMVAHVVRRHGLGNGFGMLLASGWLVVAVRPWLKIGPLLSAHHAVDGVTLLAMIVPLAVVLRWRVGGIGEAALRVPTSGIAPVGDGAGITVLVLLLATLPFAEITARLADLSFTLSDHRQIVIAMMIAMTVVWSFAFARPRVVARIATRAGLAAPSRATFWRATFLSIALLLFVVTPAILTYLVAPATITGLADLITVGVVVAVALDLFDDLRARRASLVPAWSLQHAQHADLVARDLASADIPCHLSASHLRTLLAFFGPFVPIDVLVPPEHATAARDRIATLLAA